MVETLRESQTSGRAGAAPMRRAVAAIQRALATDPTLPVPIPDIAAAAGVSQSTLERQFRRALGRSPQAYVLHLRLAAARRTLAAGEACSVLDAALHHGFGHPGRFAIAYARAFGESPSATLRAARAAPVSPRPVGPALGWIVLRPLEAAGDTQAARRATDALAAALCRRRTVALCDPDATSAVEPRALYRLQGRIEASGANLQLVHPARGIVLAAWRESLRSREKVSWADRAVAGATEAIVADQAEAARRMPRPLATADALVGRARPFALMPDRDTAAMVFDLLGEALHRDPAHAMAHALLASCHGQAANHAFTPDPHGSRAQALAHAQRATALCPDDPDVLTIASAAMSLARRLDEAETLVRRSLMLNPNQPAAWRRLGFIENFRGNGPLAIDHFRRAYHAWPRGPGGGHAMFGLGVATFITHDYPRAARILTRVLERHRPRAWQHRFLAAAAMHAGAAAEARRSLTTLRHAYPDLTVERLRRSGVLHHEALGRVLDALADAGLPHG